jgi:EAL domain-containing protein (putative c-di-GMP-specific phosphodiesterase class I)/CheY-like chemotaxis protein
MEPMQSNSIDIPSIHENILRDGIMVVEDSHLQRSVTIELLKRIGVSRLFEAASGLEALILLEKVERKPAIIIADLEMPGMDGIELIQQLAEKYSDIALIVASGVDRKLLDTLGSMVEACNMTFLGAFAKPLNGHALIKSLLGYKPSTRLGRVTSQPTQVNPGDLKRAIRSGHIVPFYQPKISLVSGKVVGYEALARWRDPVKGIIPPAAFIDVATECGLLKELTNNMMDSILADMTAWNRLELFPQVSINISVTLLEDRNFANNLIRSLSNANIDPKKIMLEITESALMKDHAVALASIGRLKLKGFGFSIDDYGTGFSSMQQLSRIAFTELKIDKSFVNSAIGNQHMAQLLGSAIDMGRKLGLVTVAEGVETIEELTLLKQLGCHQLQGFLFSKPMPVGDVVPWLEEYAKRIEKMCL